MKGVLRPAVSAIASPSIPVLTDPIPATALPADDLPPPSSTLNRPDHLLPTPPHFIESRDPPLPEPSSSGGSSLLTEDVKPYVASPLGALAPAPETLGEVTRLEEDEVMKDVISKEE